VAAAWATIAGWILISGHVTAVPTRIWLVAPAIAPNTDQTNELFPCCDVHGWKMIGNRRERETRLFRGTCEMHEILRACSSEESVKPISTALSAF